jgi:hypothetical protein
VGDKRFVDYTFYSYTGVNDLELGDLEDVNKNHKYRINRIYSKLLSLMVESIDNYQLKEICQMLDTTPVRLFESMYLADVLSMLLNLRLFSYGSEIGLNGICPCAEQHQLRAGQQGQGYHDLNSIVIRRVHESIANPFPLTAELVDGVEVDGNLIKTIEFEPLRFEQLRELKELQEYPLHIRLLYLCSTNPKFNDALYDRLSLDDIDILRKASLLLERFGPNRDIEMDCAWDKCPHGGMEWKSRLILGENYEEFYAGLMCAPRMHADIGGTRAYFDEISFFWSTGQDAPSKDLDAILTKTPLSRDNITEKLKEFYASQKKAHDEAMAKSKRK